MKRLTIIISLLCVIYTSCDDLILEEIDNYVFYTLDGFTHKEERVIDDVMKEFENLLNMKFQEVICNTRKVVFFSKGEVTCSSVWYVDYPYVSFKTVNYKTVRKELGHLMGFTTLEYEENE